MLAVVYIQYPNQNALTFANQRWRYLELLVKTKTPKQYLGYKVSQKIKHCKDHYSPYTQGSAIQSAVPKAKSVNANLYKTKPLLNLNEFK
jgi:hypothetical protein